MKVFLSRLTLFCTILFTAASVAQAEVPLDGYFIAQKSCPAYRSFRDQTNPGDVTIVPDRAYKLIAGNRAEPTHYWIVVPGVDPERRWVAIGCGIRAVTPAEAPAAPGEPAGAPPTPRKTQYVFAASWQPGFCEAQAGKPECASQTGDRFDAAHFALHGLWPQRLEYCSVPTADESNDKAGRWGDLPAVNLTVATKGELDTIMPGTQSMLERHEWTRHGTCYGTKADEYFSDALAMMSALNASSVRELFAANIGKRLTQTSIRAAFDTAFGAGAGERVRIACKDDGARRLITEITIGLTGTIGSPADFAPLILAAAPTDGGCNAGIVDPVGLQ